jgi:NADPH:quinone reductase-like Zn-dependent oxidoreductase
MVEQRPFKALAAGSSPAQPMPQDLAILGDLMQAGKVKPAIDRTYPLSQIREAIRYLAFEGKWSSLWNNSKT